MASHRRPKERSLSGFTTRTAATLAMAGAASVAILGETGHADPNLTPGQARAKVDKLYEEAEQATERYNGAKEKADTVRGDIERLQDELARRTAGLSQVRNRLGQIATAQYRNGGVDPVMRLGLDADPGEYLQRAGLMERMSSRRTTELRTLTTERDRLRQLRAEAGHKLGTLRATQHELGDHKREVEDKLREAERLLKRLTTAQRAAVLAGDGSYGSYGPSSGYGTHAGGTALRADRGGPGGRAGLTTPASPRAAQAIAFAFGAIGSPYVWGATGPSAFDCSGLTQAAWGSAGVSLPRTTYTQINAGQRVSRSELQPGDLIFFFSGISHVGLYIGDGQMIHAPRPGTAVRIAPIDQMPFAGATRPI